MEKETNNSKEMNEIKENINLNLDIKYINDDEYKECLLKVYNIKLKKKDIKKLDDDDMFKIIVEKIKMLKNKLERNNEIVILCNLSAKVMLSEDLEIGLLILHSYDYFELFYQLYSHFYKTEEINSEVYAKLLEKLK